MTKVTAVVVAFNREKLLQECLDAIAQQDTPVSEIVVVDNASTDKSAQVAQKHPAVTQFLQLHENTGGAGGFAAGIAYALQQVDLAASDYLWIMDDDTIPTPSALGELLKAAASYQGKVAVLASQAQWFDGSTHPMNTHRARPFLNSLSREKAATVGAIPIRAASFVSILIEVAQVRQVGLPIADYFIWNDDLEYTARLLKNRVGLYVPSSIVVHKTKALAGATDDPGDRFYYEVRNKIWFLLYSKGLRINDRVLYGGSMLVRWSRMLLNSASRQDLLKTGWKGLCAGLKRRPQANPLIFAADPEVAKMVAETEAQVGL